MLEIGRLGKKNGQGLFTWSTGNNLVGEWKNGYASGIGAYTNLATGTKYFGEWKNTKRSGQGAEIYVSGKRYVGEWKNNKKNGQGIYTYKDGSKEEGIWNNNVFEYGKKGTSFNTETANRKLPTCPSDRSKKFNNCFGINVFLADNDNKGDIYVGEYKDNNRHGQGNYYYLADNNNKGDIYVGQYQAGKLSGKGTYTFKDGEKYKGEWKSNKRYGQGVNTYLNGSKKEGIWKDDVFQYAQEWSVNVSTLPACPSDQTENYHDCYGTYVFASGNKYVGEFKDNERYGQGTFTWADGDKYVGDFKDAKMHGQGTYTYGPNSEWAGDKYVGEYKDNQYYGQGTFTYADGEKYVGEFKEGKRNGKGTFTYLSGDKYVGEYKDDKRYGQGTYTFKSGVIWVGEWKNSELNGYAIKYYATGDINQEGIFKDGKFLYAQNSKHPPCPSDQTENYHDCYGTYVFANGDTYVGEYKDNKYYGQGTYTYANGDKYVGEYKKGKQSGQGTTFFTSGAKYIGEYKDDKWYGQGTYYWADGRKDVGIFENDKLNGYAITYHADGSMKQQGIFKDDKFLYAQNSPSNNNQNTCNEDPALCTIVQLCSKASHYYGGKKKWQTNYSSKKYIIEAEKNGVSCGVNSEIAQSKKDEIFPAASGSGFFITKDATSLLMNTLLKDVRL